METTAIEPSAPAPDPYEPVLAELEKRSTRKPGPWRGLLTFGISLIVFFAIGAFRWEVPFIVSLVVVLFIHETGHYLAMRLFRYRNLRMFFIPLFGAAVSGESLRVAGWKKALVSLMGPLPGIALGMGLGVVSALTRQPWLMDAAVVFLVLNTLNLLPFLPLDGGWFMHGVLFCRNRWVETGFTLVAGLGLAALGLGGDRFLLFLGIVVATTTPHVYRTGTVVRNLRRSGQGTQAGDADEIPRDAVVEIAEEIRKVMPDQAARPANLARLVQTVYERLHAVPPRFLASAVLLVLYAVAMGFGVVGSGAAIFVRALQTPEGRKEFQQALDGQGLAELRAITEPAALTDEERMLAVASGIEEDAALVLRRCGTRLSPLQGWTEDGALRPMAGLAVAVPAGRFPRSVRLFLNEELGSRGYEAFVTTNSFGAMEGEVGLVRNLGPAEIVRARGTRAPGGVPDNAVIVQRLSEWQHLHGVRLTGAGPNWISLELEQAPPDRSAFVEEIRGLCPAAVPPEAGAAADFAKELEATRVVFLAWGEY